MADPQVAPLLGPLSSPPEGARPCVVVGRHDGSVVAAIAGWVRDGSVHVEQHAGDIEVAAMLERHAPFAPPSRFERGTDRRGRSSARRTDPES
jgi:hypothetical protein